MNRAEFNTSRDCTIELIINNLVDNHMLLKKKDN